MKTAAKDILLEQLLFIKSKKPNKRQPYELTLALNCFKACTEELVAQKGFDWSKIPTEDIEAMVDKKRMFDGK